MGNRENEKDLLKAALFKLAMGYEYEEKIVEADKDSRVKAVKIVKKYAPPDLKAIERIQYLMRNGKW